MITTSDGAALNQNGTKNDSAVINIFSKTDKDQTKENTDLYFKEEGRKKEEGMMNRILPFMVIPFMVSTAMIPMMLISLKIMLLKSAFIGKLAVLLLILNLFRKARKKEEDLMSKILPMMVMPFMVQTTLLPMMLMSMKFMLAQSMILGKLAIILGAVTLLRNHLKNGGGLFSHNINIQSQSHHHDLSHQNYALEGGPNSGPYKKGTRKKRAAEILLN
ncbi:hypothetical protein BDFB_008015 [Asbolus verrucosus]|uniref:Uncharacterized protein n=1 Tax=Asbolus verrucosus TaxID=1661398 RepID=A0A482VGC5_ASBVE|nr:hypothetical protein BDFB_008015 [Asbolus verrucosus]